MAKVVSRHTIEGKWKCPICGNMNLGRYRNCTSCNTPRGSTKVELPSNPEQAPTMTHEEFRHLSDQANSGTSLSQYRDTTPIPNSRNVSDTSDWICEYCGGQNGSWHEICQGCGAPRNDKMPTYHEITQHATRTGLTREQATDDLISSTTEFSSNQCTNDEAGRTSIRNVAEQKIGYVIDFIKQNATHFLVGLGVIAIIGFIIWLLIPHPKEIVPTKFDWNREIRISHLVTVEEDDWYVPAGGRVFDERLEHHHDEKVHDGWHTETYTEYEYQKTGTRRWTEYEDNGDGSYDAVTYEEDVYENVPVTKTREVEDYHYEPRYQTKYYYYIERWKYHRSVTTSGEDQNPYWGEVILSGPTGEYGTGEEKEESRVEEYGVTCEDGERYVANQAIWKKLELGGKRTVMIQLGKIVEIVDHADY